MTELLTESFCERCGTRYELNAPEPLSTVKKTRGLVTGLRTFVMGTDSLSDSIGDAMRAEEEAFEARQIDAFEETFSFCLDCRRYTCVSCWNDEPGRCRSCAPVPGIDDIAGSEALTAEAGVIPAPADPSPVPNAQGEPAWPAEDKVERPTEPEVEAPDEPQVIPGLATAPLADGALAAEADAAAPEFEPFVPLARPPVERLTVEGRTAVPSVPASETLAVRQSQLDILGIEDPGEGTVAAGQREQLPYRSSGAAAVGGSQAVAAVWNASTRALEAGTQQAALRPCGSCGLTVSSTARFCRRCGAPQTLSA